MTIRPETIMKTVLLIFCYGSLSYSFFLRKNPSVVISPEYRVEDAGMENTLNRMESSISRIDHKISDLATPSTSEATLPSDEEGAELRDKKHLEHENSEAEEESEEFKREETRETGEREGRSIAGRKLMEANAARRAKNQRRNDVNILKKKKESKEEEEEIERQEDKDEEEKQNHNEEEERALDAKPEINDADLEAEAKEEVQEAARISDASDPQKDYKKFEEVLSESGGAGVPESKSSSDRSSVEQGVQLNENACPCIREILEEPCRGSNSNGKQDRAMPCNTTTELNKALDDHKNVESSEHSSAPSSTGFSEGTQ